MKTATEKLVDRLRNYHVNRDDCIEAAKLIEASHIGPRWHHKKRGTNYTQVGQARLNYSERLPADGEMLTLYLGDDGVYSVRHPDEFLDGRFEPIE